MMLVKFWQVKTVFDFRHVLQFNDLSSRCLRSYLALMNIYIVYPLYTSSDACVWVFFAWVGKYKLAFKIKIETVLIIKKTVSDYSICSSLIGKKIEFQCPFLVKEVINKEMRLKSFPVTKNQDTVYRKTFNRFFHRINVALPYLYSMNLYTDHELRGCTICVLTMILKFPTTTDYMVHQSNQNNKQYAPENIAAFTPLDAEGRSCLKENSLRWEGPFRGSSNKIEQNKILKTSETMKL